MLGRALGESEMLDLFHIARSFAETRCPWLLSPPNKALATAPFHSAMVGRFPEARLRFQHERPGFPTANDHNPANDLWAALDDADNGPAPRVRNADLEVTRFSITPGHMGTRRCQSKMAIERDLGQSGRTASVDQTNGTSLSVTDYAIGV